MLRSGAGTVWEVPEENRRNKQVFKQD